MGYWKWVVFGCLVFVVNDDVGVDIGKGFCNFVYGFNIMNGYEVELKVVYMVFFCLVFYVFYDEFLYYSLFGGGFVVVVGSIGKVVIFIVVIVVVGYEFVEQGVFCEVGVVVDNIQYYFYVFIMEGLYYGFEFLDMGSFIGRVYGIVVFWYVVVLRVIILVVVLFFFWFVFINRLEVESRENMDMGNFEISDMVQVSGCIIWCGGFGFCQFEKFFFVCNV